MAKIRRIVRKIAPPHGDYFDEHLWPVYIALVVLGAFLLGISAAYLKFSGVPWYANAMASLVGIPLVIIGFMIAFRYIDNRVVRRSMQLAVLVSAILHVAMVIHMIETKIFSGYDDEAVTEREVIEPRKRRLMPQYQPQQLLPEEDRPKQDFEKPLEIRTPQPQPEPENVVRQETQPETTQAPEQPVPLLNPEATPQPNVVKRTQPNEVAPRAAEQPSKLSRQSRPSELKISQLVQSLPVQQPSPAGVESARAAATSVERQTTEINSQPPAVEAPSAPTRGATLAVERKADGAAPQVNAAPSHRALTRQVAQPSRTQASPIAAADVPPQPQATSPEAIAPASTLTQRQATASPQVNQADAPLPEISSTAEVRIQRRQSPAEAAPQIAQSPSPTPNRQPRATTRPDVTATAAATVPAPTNPPAAALTRRAAASAETALAAASTATRRQATAAPQAAPSAGEPAPLQMAALTPAAEASNNLPRRATGEPSALPTVGPPGPTTPSQTRSTTAAVANVVTRAAEVATNSGPQPGDAMPGPSSTEVARQAAGPVTNEANPAPPAAPQSGAVAMSSGGISRAQQAELPTIRPQVLAGTSPARAAMTSPTATSPAAMESPAANLSASSGPPAMQPASLALTRSESGTAGVGRSPNLDRDMPGSQSPALIASASARRAEATTQTPGDAFTPSSPAQIARTRAGQERPTAAVRVETAAAGSIPAAAEVSALTASSSATLQRADTQATRSEVTGAKGAAEIDIGATQLVAERGGTRAAGGGQSEPNTDLSARQVARAEPDGGLPRMALATAQVADQVAAPAGESGGSPASLEAQVAGVSRTTVAAPAAMTGGPQAADAAGEASEATAAQLAAQTDRSRAEASEGAAGGGTAGLTDPEDEEERARRLARASQGGAPQLAVAGPVIADVVASRAGDGGDAGDAANPEPRAMATSATRLTAEGAAPTGGSASPAPDTASSPDLPGAAAVASVAIARAEAADGTPGTPLIGGGSASPTKASSAPTFAADTMAEAPQLAGAPQSSGQPAGASLAARGTQTERMSGVSGPVTNEPPGAQAAADALMADVAAGPATGERQGRGGEDGPQVSSGQSASALAKAGTGAGPSSSAIVADIPEVGAGSAVAQAELDHMMGGTANMPMTRQSGEALAVHAEAPEGPGGLGSEYAPEVGINSRKAREESLHVQTAATRFVRTTVGGLPAVSTSAIVPREPFARRSARLDGDQRGTGRGAVSPQTEVAIELGLAFLARHQHADGHWSLQGFDDATSAVSDDERRFMLVSDTGATALAILAFQGGGYTHREQKYKDVLHRGINHLLAYQKANGDLFVPLDDRSNQSVWLYSHGLAALALCEAYGMTGDPALKAPAQKAVDFIVASQNKDLGGWRYAPEFDENGTVVGGIGTDTSVTGWMVAALYSARLAGLEVPDESFRRIEKWMNSAQGAGGESHLYRYNPFAPDTPQQRHGRVPSKTMTAVGLLSRALLGWKHNHPALGRGAEFLSASPPSIGTQREPQRDTYYWYYATLALVYLKERDPQYVPLWNQWEATLHPLLRGTQEQRGPWAGSWNPRGPVPDRWGLHAGRLYVTTMNLLSLEASYRYSPLHASVLGETAANEGE